MIRENPQFKKQYENTRKAFYKESKKLIEIVEPIDAGKIVLQELNEEKKLSILQQMRVYLTWLVADY